MFQYQFCSCLLPLLQDAGFHFQQCLLPLQMKRARETGWMFFREFEFYYINSIYSRPNSFPKFTWHSLKMIRVFTGNSCKESLGFQSSFFNHNMKRILKSNKNSEIILTIFMAFKEFGLLMKNRKFLTCFTFSLHLKKIPLWVSKESQNTLHFLRDLFACKVPLLEPSLEADFLMLS